MFAVRSDRLYLYVLTNRRLINNLQSTLEIEVWRWNDSDNCIEEHTQRQYLPFYITDSEGKHQGEQTFYAFPITEKIEDDQLQEFWNKQPICFRQSSDDPSRIIFRAGSRSNWIFDLRLVDGGLRLWPA